MNIEQLQKPKHDNNCAVIDVQRNDLKQGVCIYVMIGFVLAVYSCVTNRPSYISSVTAVFYEHCRGSRFFLIFYQLCRSSRNKKDTEDEEMHSGDRRFFYIYKWTKRAREISARGIRSCLC